MLRKARLGRIVTGADIASEGNMQHFSGIGMFYLNEALDVRYKDRFLSGNQKADILLGASVYYFARGYPSVAISDVFPEIATQLEQPETSVFERYESLISSMRDQFLEVDDSDHPVKKETVCEEFDEMMENKGFLWDEVKGEYVNISTPV